MPNPPPAGSTPIALDFEQDEVGANAIRVKSSDLPNLRLSALPLNSDLDLNRLADAVEQNMDLRPLAECFPTPPVQATA